jgi:hypothetical protein
MDNILINRESTACAAGALKSPEAGIFPDISPEALFFP